MLFKEVIFTKVIPTIIIVVYLTLVSSLPVGGYVIQKFECANHASKCYHLALEKLVQENPSYEGKESS